MLRLADGEEHAARAAVLATGMDDNAIDLRVEPRPAVAPCIDDGRLTGVELEDGTTAARCRTSVPGLYACGDAAAGMPHVPRATAEGARAGAIVVGERLTAPLAAHAGAR